MNMFHTDYNQFQEVERLHNPLWLETLHFSTWDFEYCGYLIPKDSVIVINTVCNTTSLNTSKLISLPLVYYAPSSSNVFKSPHIHGRFLYWEYKKYPIYGLLARAISWRQCPFFGFRCEVQNIFRPKINQISWIHIPRSRTKIESPAGYQRRHRGLYHQKLAT